MNVPPGIEGVLGGTFVGVYPGHGFDTSVPPDGHGLGNLRSRTAALEGTLTVVSAPGAGTSIILHLPIAT